MRYALSDRFVKLNESEGTIQNVHQFRSVEIAPAPIAGSGVILASRDKFTFKSDELWARCTSTNAEIRIVPFFVDSFIINRNPDDVDDSQLYRVILTFGYTGTDFTRKYRFDKVDADNVSHLRTRVLAVNDSLKSGSDDGLSEFFRADDFNAELGVGNFNRIVAARTITNLSTPIF